MFKISKTLKIFSVLFLLLISFLITDSKANAQSCDDSWDTSARGCKTNCMKDGLFCNWADSKSWADSNTNDCVVESTTACPTDPANGTYSFSCNTNDCVLSCASGYTKCGTSCVANDPLPANCTSYDQCTDTCTSCTAGYTLVSGVCEGVSLKLANDSVASGGNIIQSSNPIFYINPIGNVGISTSTPQSKLHVIGGVKMSNLDGSYRVPTADTELVPLKYVNENFAPITGGSGSAFLQGGNSFGTIATLGTKDAYNLDFITSSTTRMTIDTSGNVGIGTTSPVRALDVYGNVQLGKTGGNQEKTVNIAGNINFESVKPPTTTELQNITLTGTTGGTLISGDTYYYNVVYYTAEGDTIFGDYADYLNITLAAGENAVNLSNIPTSDNPNVIGRVIFRGSNYHTDCKEIYRLSNNVDTTFTDTGYFQDDDNIIYRKRDDTAASFYKDNVLMMYSGLYRTSFGSRALSSLISGHSTVAFGPSALRDVTSGSDNVGIGYSAGVTLNTGSSNIAIGYATLFNASGASNDNIVIGSNAARQTSGSRLDYSNAIGTDTLNSVDVDIFYSNAFGYEAGKQFGGNYNNLIGAYTGSVPLKITNADYNTYIGHGVGQNTATGASNNILIGKQLELPVPSGDNQLSIGNLIYGTDLSSGGIVSTGNVGIATTTPQSKLHVIGAAKMSNLDGSYRVPIADTELVPKYYVDENFVSTAGGSSATFVGLTPSTYNGNQGGYESANTLCSNEYADSHVCSTQEIYNTINLGLISSFPAGPVTFWLNSGPPGYKANVNDCTGWKSSSAGFYGAVWVISGTTFSSGIDECFETRAFACCSSS
ncbi:MAG TPA: hypothetical protein VJ926_02440 [Patescibacteria group bacterium]|nr:hypothetical protein [Patescibacteria group bacterium]